MRYPKFRVVFMIFHPKSPSNRYTITYTAVASHNTLHYFFAVNVVCKPQVSCTRTSVKPISDVFSETNYPFIIPVSTRGHLYVNLEREQLEFTTNSAINSLLIEVCTISHP